MITFFASFRAEIVGPRWNPITSFFLYLKHLGYVANYSFMEKSGNSGLNKKELLTEWRDDLVFFPLLDMQPIFWKGSRDVNIAYLGTIINNNCLYHLFP